MAILNRRRAIRRLLDFLYALDTPRVYAGIVDSRVKQSESLDR